MSFPGIWASRERSSVKAKPGARIRDWTTAGFGFGLWHHSQVMRASRTRDAEGGVRFTRKDRPDIQYPVHPLPIEQLGVDKERTCAIRIILRTTGSSTRLSV